MLVYLASPQTLLHLCKISDKVDIYLVLVRDVEGLKIWGDE